jgi:ATP-dependent Clp protease ATP-binding subunit ClpC
MKFTFKRDEVVEEQKTYEEMRKKLLESLKKVFRPEFVNRLDGIIVFHALGRDHIKQIVSLELQKVSDRLKDHQIKIEATENAIQQLADEGYDPDMGARPLRRVIQQKVEDPLSDAVLSGGFKDGETVWVDLNDDKEIVLSQVKNKAPDVSLAKIKV